ncbi:hypothetical protein D1224_09645 [Henriciella barbarensis]|uniref:Uncharacterized protein n=2 Tax=Henriciella barbarensis TaxID=86342 RepID=A0A399QZB2_9PROT|nr:hypothetical protein D1224_09645 [Henriciella barbarensis]
MGGERTFEKTKDFYLRKDVQEKLKSAQRPLIPSLLRKDRRLDQLFHHYAYVWWLSDRNWKKDATAAHKAKKRAERRREREARIAEELEKKRRSKADHERRVDQGKEDVLIRLAEKVNAGQFRRVSRSIESHMRSESAGRKWNKQLSVVDELSLIALLNSALDAAEEMETEIAEVVSSDKSRMEMIEKIALSFSYYGCIDIEAAQASINLKSGSLTASRSKLRRRSQALEKLREDGWSFTPSE